MLVNCHCGCGSQLESPDRKGRSRRYITGHAKAGRPGNWEAIQRWRKENPNWRKFKEWDDYPEPVRDSTSGCLLWQGPLSPEGYGRIGRLYAHRVAYKKAFGVIPDNLHVDHVLTKGCLNRNCVEPSHLEAVTPGENFRRGSKAIEVATRTQCIHGHALDSEKDFYYRIRTRNGKTSMKRECRRCYYNRQNVNKRRKRAERKAGFR